MRVATVDGTSRTGIVSESACCSCTISRCRSNGNALQQVTPIVGDLAREIGGRW